MEHPLQAYAKSFSGNVELPLSYSLCGELSPGLTREENNSIGAFE